MRSHKHTHDVDPTSDWPCTFSLTSSWPLGSPNSQCSHPHTHAKGVSLPASPEQWPCRYSAMSACDYSSCWLRPVVTSQTPWCLSPDIWPFWLLSLSFHLPSHSASSSLAISHWHAHSYNTHTQVSPAASTTDTHASVLSVSGCWYSACHCLMPLGSSCTWRWTSCHRAQWLLSPRTYSREGLDLINYIWLMQCFQQHTLIMELSKRSIRVK